MRRDLIGGRARAGVLCVCIAAAFVGTATSAGAAPRSGPTHRHIAGYVQNGAGSDTVNATLTVPTVACTDSSAPFEGAAEGGIVFTDGGERSMAAVATGCFGASPVYAAILTVNGVQTQYNDLVAPGDVVIAAVGAGATGVSASLRDRTQQWHHRLTNNSARTTTEMGVGSIAFGCAPSGCSPAAVLSPAKFVSVHFDGDGLDGATKSAFKAADGSVEMNASKVGPAGTGFTTRWVSTCDPGAGTLC